MSELQILYPQPVVVLVGDRRVAIKAVRLSQFDTFGRAASQLLDMLDKSSAAKIYTWARSSGVLVSVLGGCTSLSRWRIRRLPSVVAVQLMLKVLEVNNDFFGQALARAASR